MIKNITEKEFKNETEGKKVLLQFHATWCGPCKMLGMVINEFDKEGIIDILRIDVDEAGELANQFKIFSVPTLVILDNGNEVKRISGFMPKEELERRVTENE